MSRKTLKQRQFKRIFGYYLIQNQLTFYKVTDNKVVRATEEEIKDYILFSPTHPFKMIFEDFVWLAKLIGIKYNQFKLFQAKVMANAKSKASSGRRFYVLPDWQGKYRVVSRGDVKKLQAKGIMSKRVTFKDLINEALYFTK